MIVPRYYENLSVLHENTMPARAYYIPASKRMDNLVEHREESDRMQLLNGTWKFQYFNSIYDIQDSFFEKDYDTEHFDVIQVPSVWQMAGYDVHQYTNIRYPFPFDPPYVPQDIPCGAYVHTFDYSRDEKASRAFLNFEGVDSCFYVWINGSYVGYSQVSHMTSEFDITDVLQDGTNTVAVLVMKWCDGSYLWEKENFPILDRLYQEKDLEALMDFYEQAVEENRTIDRWEHSGIFRWLMSCRDAREYLALEQSGETLNEYQQALLLDDYWMMRGLDYSEVILTEKDREYIRPYVEATLNSLADRYTFTAEEEKKFEDSLRNNYGYPRYEDCEEYIKKHNE